MNRDNTISEKKRMLKKLKSGLEQFSERPVDKLNDKESESKVGSN